MSKEDWYRKRIWSESDEKEFFARLKESRTDFHKAQYLRIQASYLQSIGTQEMALNSLRLLNLILKEYPEKSQLSPVYLQKAECLITLGKIESAIDEMRNALQSERELPNIKTSAWLEFGWTAITYQLSYLYDEAIKILNEFDSNLTFPIDKYRWNAIQAIVENEKANKIVAKKFALSALEAGSLSHSGFRYHQRLGLVQNMNEKIHSRLTEIAN